MIAAACAVSSLATWEVAARLEDWAVEGASPLRPYGINSLFRASRVGREGVPGAHFGKWRMNTLGFRGDEPAARRSNVLAVGASETFGQHESPGHEYPRLLEDELGARSKGRYNVINAALPGMRLGRIAYLERALDLTHPRYVVIYPTPAHYIGVDRPYCTLPPAPAPSPPTLGERVRIVGRLELLAKRITPPAVIHALRALDLRRAGAGAAPMARVPDASVDAFRADLECAVDAARARGATPVLLTHATYFGPSGMVQDDAARAQLVAWRRFYPELAEEGFLDLERRANAVVREVATRRGALFLDAASALPAGPDLFADFVHFTDRGSQALAREIAGVITRDEGVSRNVSPRRGTIPRRPLSPHTRPTERP
jgi:lysophospholipase L1-like esterase